MRVIAQVGAARCRTYLRSNRSSPRPRQGSRCSIASARAATSARPRLRPWPARGWTTCAASPSSTQPGPHHASARPRTSGHDARSDASARLPTSAPAASARARSNAASSPCSSACGALLGQRPDERIGAARLGPIERQQCEHVGSAKPLARDVPMRPRSRPAAPRSRAGRSRCARCRRRARRAWRRRGLRSARSASPARRRRPASRAARSAARRRARARAPRHR